MDGGKNTETESKKNSSTLGVIGVVDGGEKVRGGEEKLPSQEKSYKNFSENFFWGPSLPGGTKISKSVTVGRQAFSSSI